MIQPKQLYVILLVLGLSKFVNDDKTFNYDKLHEVTKVVTDNLNKVIDINFYPTDKTKRSNMRHRPIGVGVQGLADVFAMMDVAFHSDEAKEINKNIFETIYHASMEMSMEISKDRFFEIDKAKTEGRYSEKGVLSLFNEYEYHLESSNYCGAYSTFEGSPLSHGIFQFDMWNVTPSSRYDWSSIKRRCY